MKQGLIKLLVGFLFFTVMFLLYNLLFKDDLGVNEILLGKMPSAAD